MIAPRPAAVHHPLQVRGQPDRVGHLGHQRRARPSRHAPAIGGDVEPRTVSASVHLQGEPSSWMVRASITRIFPGREGFPMQPTPAPRQSRETSRLAACNDDSAGPETGADVEDVAQEEPVAEQPLEMEPTAEDSPAVEETVEEEAAGETGLADEAESFVGQQVTVSATISEMVSPAAFRI